jgi:hypothetical protein
MYGHENSGVRVKSGSVNFPVITCTENAVKSVKTAYDCPVAAVPAGFIIIIIYIREIADNEMIVSVAVLIFFTKID